MHLVAAEPDPVVPYPRHWRRVALQAVVQWHARLNNTVMKGCRRPNTDLRQDQLFSENVGELLRNNIYSDKHGWNRAGVFSPVSNASVIG